MERLIKNPDVAESGATKLDIKRSKEVKNQQLGETDAPGPSTSTPRTTSSKEVSPITKLAVGCGSRIRKAKEQTNSSNISNIQASHLRVFYHKPSIEQFDDNVVQTTSIDNLLDKFKPMNFNLNHSNLCHLTSQCSIGSVFSVFDNIKNRTVFNLITKNSAFERTSYPSLAACLSTLEHKIKDKNIKKTCCTAI